MKTKIYSLVIVSISLLSLTFCKNSDEKPEERDPNIKLSVKASVETIPVNAKKNDDAADDPAIWVNPVHPERSFVIGTDKKSGLYVYDLQGQVVSFINAGLVNNVDVRDSIQTPEGHIILVACSNRTDNTVKLYKLNPQNGKLSSVNENGLPSNLKEVYGFCLYHEKRTKKVYAFVNGKSGTIEQWLLNAENSNKINGKFVRTLKVDTQPEGMVADDEKGSLYVGEEARGVWKFNAAAEANNKPQFLKKSGSDNPKIKYDVEGITLFYQPNGKGYLIVSSQGNYSYAVFEREGNNKYLFSFFIDNGNIDGVEETDGIDVTNQYLGEQFPNGMFVVQDGFNFDNDTLKAQNFKYIDWREIANVSDNKLLSDSSYVW
jgi:3-phytase